MNLYYVLQIRDGQAIGLWVVPSHSPKDAVSQLKVLPEHVQYDQYSAFHQISNYR